MPNKLIPLEADQIYHIWTHANGSENLFSEEENYNYFLKQYAHHVHPIVETFAYCLMPNHLHLMIKVRNKELVLEFLRLKEKQPNLQSFEDLGGFSNCISQKFSNLFNGYAKAYNNRYNRMGSLFTPNFKRKLVESERYFNRLIIYIHQNPVHHNFVKDIADWPYSSYNAYRLNRKTKLNKEQIIDWFGSKKQFFEAHQQISTVELFNTFEG